MTDHLTKEQRSLLMGRVRGKDTGPELIIRSELHKRGHRFRKHVKSLPGSPDIVFPKALVAVFIDGDFWHGYRFPKWEHKLTEFWRLKITANRARDQRNFGKLKRMGWHVIRLWQHEIERDIQLCITRIESTLEWSLKSLQQTE